MRHADWRVQRVIERFEGLERADVARLGEIYADDASFKDPFNDVRGLAPIQRIFEHMFESLVAPRFAIGSAIAQGDEAFLTWQFHLALKRRPREPLCICGGTHLRFGADGRIAMHRDYWDAAEELYEKLALLGPLMRWLRRRANG
jgi:steroid Delta-isomerase